MLARYIFREVGLAAVGAVGLFTFVLLASNALRDLLELVSSGRLAAATALQLVGLLLPYLLSFALPFGLLAGTLLALGRMSAQRELVAMRAAGVSVWALAAPVLLLALLASGLSVVFNGWLGPDARLQYRGLLADAFRHEPLRFFVPGTFVDQIPGFVLYVGGAEGRTLTGVRVWELDPQGRVVRFSRAGQAVLGDDPTGESLPLTLRDCATEQRDPDDPGALAREHGQLAFADVTVRLPLAALTGGGGRDRPANLNQGALADRVAALEAELAALPPDVQGEARNALERAPLPFRVQAQRNLASGLAPLALALAAIPLALRTGRRETSANLAFALVLALSYFTLGGVANWFADRPAMRPELLVWVPNALYAAAGLFALARANAR